MGVLQYKIGKQHGLDGMQRLSHRRDCRLYDSKSAQTSYDRGYSEGARERLDNIKRESEARDEARSI